MNCDAKSDIKASGFWSCNVHLFAKHLGLKSDYPWWLNIKIYYTNMKTIKEINEAKKVDAKDLPRGWNDKLEAIYKDQMDE